MRLNRSDYIDLARFAIAIALLFLSHKLQHGTWTHVPSLEEPVIFSTTWTSPILHTKTFHLDKTRLTTMKYLATTTMEYPAEATERAKDEPREMRVCVEGLREKKRIVSA
jgi:hypothetical protein